MYYLRIDKDVGAICFKDTCLRAAGEESSRPRIPGLESLRTAAPEQTGLRTSTQAHNKKDATNMVVIMLGIERE
jgi:hypothetical protein